MPLPVYNTDVGAKTVRGGRRPNATYRSREHLTEDEVFRLMEAARDNRYGARDAALIFTMYRHGLRVSEGNQSPRRQNRNSKKPSRDRRPKPAPHGPKFRKLPTRDWGAPVTRASNPAVDAEPGTEAVNSPKLIVRRMTESELNLAL